MRLRCRLVRSFEFWFPVPVDIPSVEHVNALGGEQSQYFQLDSVDLDMRRLLERLVVILWYQTFALDIHGRPSTHCP